MSSTWPVRFSSGRSGDEAFFQIARAGARHQFGRRAGRQHLAGVHGDDPIPLLGFVHVSGGDDDAHARAAGANVVDQRPELAARQRIDARRRLIENEQIRLVHQCAAEADLLFHAARQLAGRAIRERAEAGGVEQFLDLRRARCSGKTEEPRHEVDVLLDAQLEIKVLAEALRHIGDARTSVAPVAGVGHIAVKRDHLSLLDRFRAGDQRHQCRFADAVGADDADHAAARNVEREIVDRHGLAVAMGDAFDGDGRSARLTTAS